MRILLIVALSFLTTSQCAKILGVFHVPGKSHYTAGSTLMKILAEKGHEVTMIAAFPEKNPPKNFKSVVLTRTDTEEKIDFFNFNVHPYLQTYIYQKMGIGMTNHSLSHPKFKEFLNTKEKFDLIILEQFYSDGLKYLSVHFDAPLILYSAVDASSWTNPSVGNPAPPSYVPDLVLPYLNEMTFLQRLDNTILTTLSEIIRNTVVLPGHDEIIKLHFPGAPDISEYYHKASVVLLNGDISVSPPVPKVPGMIDIGGFHIKPPKALPKDLQDVMDNAKNGVIVFSMGSNIQSANMPKETLATFLRVFSTLKQTVLWKWEDDQLPGKPNNVVTRKWLPQNDVFAHKNVRLFITHGGIFSTMEAVYHGIPCLSLPIFGDQSLNAQRATANGYARWIHFNKVTEEILKTELDEMLANPRYSENAKHRSRIMHDKPISPADKLAFWVEYVLKHDGADHLRVATLKLTWYQYLLLDVIAFILLCSVLFIIVAKFLINYLLRLCKKPKLKTN